MRSWNCRPPARRRRIRSRHWRSSRRGGAANSVSIRPPVASLTDTVWSRHAHKVRIALDAMGGDHGAAVVVPGAELSLQRHPDIEFLLFGDRAELEPLLAARPNLKAASDLVHTDVVVQMHDKPSQALRKGRRRSSMWLAVDAVKKGEADVAVSAGNTGALMAMAKIDLRTMAGIERPAIAAIWPTLRGESVVLDVGATIGADAHQLIDFAILGTGMARSV